MIELLLHRKQVSEMSFSSDVKEELSKMPVNNSDVNKAEFIGYILSGNCIKREGYFEQEDIIKNAKKINRRQIIRQLTGKNLFTKE